jgi:formylglycine-generating enzyme required for sulfatase activity
MMKQGYRLFKLLCIFSLVGSCYTNPGNLDTDKTPLSEVSNRFGMKFVLIPAGTFTMGRSLEEKGRARDERLHQVTITRPFYLQKTELTQGQW